MRRSWVRVGLVLICVAWWCGVGLVGVCGGWLVCCGLVVNVQVGEVVVCVPSFAVVYQV